MRGVELELHPPGEQLSDHIRRERDFFEADLLDYVVEKFPVQRTIIDVGANIGNHAVFFANFLKYYDTINCYEPITDNFTLLQKNVAPYERVKAYPFALSDRTQLLPMEVVRHNMGASHVDTRPDTTSDIIVQAYSLDRLYFKNVSLLKIDVEGWEPAVLSGAEDTIAVCKPLIILEDWQDEYQRLLPEKYECIKAWEVGKTFIYEWRD